MIFHWNAYSKSFLPQHKLKEHKNCYCAGYLYLLYHKNCAGYLSLGPRRCFSLWTHRARRYRICVFQLRKNHPLTMYQFHLTKLNDIQYKSTKKKLHEKSKKNTKKIDKVTAKVRDSTAAVPTSLKSWESGRIVWLIFNLHAIFIQFIFNFAT